MRPDRIVVGEVRGEEALDMLQAMNTGHDGSLTTVHANTPRDALSRIETMIAMGATNLPERAMRQQIASAIQHRRAADAPERRHAQGDQHLRDHRAWKATSSRCRRSSSSRRSASPQDGKVTGRFRATGVRPKCAERLSAAGINLPAEMFEGVVEVR